MQRLSAGEVDVQIGHRDRHDEIGRMVDAIEVFRKNIIDKHAMEQTLTAELERSVEELRALGEVSQAVNSTLDLETVLTTIVAKATQLSNTEAGAIYVFDERQREFRLRATYGMDDAMIAAIRDQSHPHRRDAIGRACEQRMPIQIPDIQSDPSSVSRCDRARRLSARS